MEARVTEKSRVVIPADVKSALEYLDINVYNFLRIHTTQLKKELLHYKFVKKECAIIKNALESSFDTQALLVNAEQAHALILASEILQEQKSEYSEHCLGLNSLRTHSVYTTQQSPRQTDSSQSIFMLGPKSSGVEPGFQAYLAKDSLLYLYRQFPTTEARHAVIYENEGDIEAIHAKFKDSLPKYQIKLTYHDITSTGRVTPSTEDLGRSSMMKSFQSVLPSIGYSFVLKTYQILKTKHSRELNAEAVLEVLANDVARAYGMTVQTQELYPAQFQNAVYQLLLLSTWIEGGSELGTAKYTLHAMSELTSERIERNKLYVRLTASGFEYRVLGWGNTIISDVLSFDSLGITTKITKLDQLRDYLPKILELTTMRGHTHIRFFAGDSNDQNYVVKPLLLSSVYAPYLADNEVSLGEYLALLYYQGDADGIGSTLQNKIRKGNTLVGIDFGKAFQESVCEFVGHDFRIMGANVSQRFKNYSIFHDSVRSEFVRGIIRLACLKGEKVSQAVIASYGSDFQDSIKRIEVGADVRIFDDYIKYFSSLMSEYTGQDEISRENAACCEAIVNAVKEAKRLGITSRNALLDRFNGYLQLTRPALELLENIEKVMAGKANTSLFSPDQNVLLRHLRIVDKHILGWDISVSPDKFIWQVRFSDVSFVDVSLRRLKQWLGEQRTLFLSSGDDFIKIEFAATKLPALCDLFNEERIKERFYPNENVLLQHAILETKITKLIRSFPDYGFRLSLSTTEEKKYQLAFHCDVLQKTQPILIEFLLKSPPAYPFVEYRNAYVCTFERQGLGYVYQFLKNLPTQIEKEQKIREQLAVFEEQSIKKLLSMTRHDDTDVFHLTLTCKNKVYLASLKRCLEVYRVEDHYQVKYEQLKQVLIELRRADVDYQVSLRDIDKQLNILNQFKEKFHRVLFVPVILYSFDLENGRVCINFDYKFVDPKFIQLLAAQFNIKPEEQNLVLSYNDIPAVIEKFTATLTQYEHYKLECDERMRAEQKSREALAAKAQFISEQCDLFERKTSHKFSECLNTAGISLNLISPEVDKFSLSITPHHPHKLLEQMLLELGSNVFSYTELPNLNAVLDATLETYQHKCRVLTSHYKDQCERIDATIQQISKCLIRPSFKDSLAHPVQVTKSYIKPLIYTVDGSEATKLKPVLDEYLQDTNRFDADGLKYISEMLRARKKHIETHLSMQDEKYKTELGHIQQALQAIEQVFTLAEQLGPTLYKNSTPLLNNQP